MNHRHAPDRGALLLAIGVHGALVLLWLMSARPPLDVPPAPEARLTLFDVAPPPPPPPPVRPPPPPPAERAAPPPRAAPAGGSPRAAAPAPRLDTTPDVAAPPMPPPPSVTSPFGSDQAVAQLAGSGAGGTGISEGSGVGLGAGSGAGGDGGEGKARYAKASWIYRPTDAELRRFWPAEAVRRHISGRVILACAVPRSGRPERCAVLTETPADMGFGAAALAMQPLFRIRPVLRNGKVVALPILVPVAFDTPPLRKR